MPFIDYVPKNFSVGSLKIVEQANSIINDYSAQGYDLTLRQIYYQFVARDLIPNKQSEYKRLGSIINDARLAGMIDWDAIVDRTRNIQSNSHWDSPKEIITGCAEYYQIDKWENQPLRPEIWIEKDALVGVVEGVARRNDVSYFSCRGYTSQSEMWSASRRLKRYANANQVPIIIHLGDHDPSGIDMTRDIHDRLELFMGGLTIDRIALNMDQIEEFNPPPNPSKITDPRASTYIKRFGMKSWELDALEPAFLEQMIDETISKYRDVDLWDTMVRKEKRHIATLKKAAKEMK